MSAFDRVVIILSLLALLGVIVAIPIQLRRHARTQGWTP